MICLNMTSLGALCETLQLSIQTYPSQTKAFCCGVKFNCLTTVAERQRREKPNTHTGLPR